jgi:hypothetical protein
VIDEIMFGFTMTGHGVLGPCSSLEPKVGAPGRCLPRIGTVKEASVQSVGTSLTKAAELVASYSHFELTLCVTPWRASSP